MPSAQTVFNSYFDNFNNRTRNLTVNVLMSFATRLIGILSTFILVPVSISYLGSATYGVWLTLSGIMYWFASFDVGLGNGLRNNLTIAIANDDKELARIYISTTYAAVGLLVLGFLIIFFIFSSFFSWNRVLNAPGELSADVQYLSLIFFFFICLQMFLQLVAVVFTADQKAAMPSFINCLINLLSLVLIYVLSETTDGSILWLGTVSSVCPIIVYGLFSIKAYNSRYSAFRPSISHVKFRYVKDLVGLGGKFFIIQVAMIICFQTTNVIVAHLFGPDEVTNLGIADKYFGILMIISTIVMFPLWSAYTEAYFKNDFDWIKRTIRRLRLLFLGLVLVGIAMYMCAEFVFKAWIGNKVHVSMSLCFVVLLKYLLFSLNNIYNYFINGVGKLRVQIIGYVTIAVFNIPMSLWLGHLVGIIGVVISNVFLISVLTLIHYVQYKKIINSRANGVWNA